MKIYLLFIGLLFCFTSCEKDPIHYKLTDFENSFVYFKKGSYWIYQNDSTLAVDSHYVTGRYDLDDPTQSDGKVIYLKEHLDGNITKSSNPTFDIDLGAQALTNEKASVYYIIRVDNHHFEWSNSLEFQNGEIVNAMKHDSLTLNGVTFTNVFEVTDVSLMTDTSTLCDTATAFFVSNVGLVGFQVHYKDSIQSNWSLLRYHIE